MTSTSARIGIRWGLILGVAVCLWTLALHVLGFYTVNPGAGQRADVLATALPVVAVVGAFRERLKRAARISFGEAISIGFVLGLTSACITVPFLWFYHHYVNPQWLELLISWSRERLNATGASPAEMEQALSRLQASGTDRSQVISGFVGSIVIAIVIAILATIVLRIREAYNRSRVGHRQ